MISGFSHHGVFHDILAAGESANHITFVGVLSTCSHMSLAAGGILLFEPTNETVWY